MYPASLRVLPLKLLFVALVLSCSLLSFSEEAVVDHGLCATLSASHPCLSAAIVPTDDDPVGMPFIAPLAVAVPEPLQQVVVVSALRSPLFHAQIRAPPVHA